MQIYIARPTRGQPFYRLTENKYYKAELVEIPEDKAQDYANTYLKFNQQQGELAMLYHKHDKVDIYPDPFPTDLHAEGIE